MREYGITTSKAAVWVHVCPIDAELYYYSRKRMLEILARLKEKEIETAIGRLCPLRGNKFCDGGFIESIEPPLMWWGEYDFKRGTKNEVGAYAEEIFRRCVDAKIFRVPAVAMRYTEKADQYQGRDFKVSPISAFDVEVKADVVGGEWGTGNLFVQTHERQAPQERAA